MVAYRFCRPDDMALICRAVNECHNVHFPGTPPLTEGGLRSEIKELDVWVSNAMVARQGEEPIGVLMGTKRPDEVLIHRLGVRSDYQRRGHGGHMLMSLSHKLAVLGPPRLVAEVPEDLAGGVPFFESAGYRVEGELADYLRTPDPEPRAVPEELFLPTTVDELLDQNLLEASAETSWARRIETLKNRREQLSGLAIASPERTEAFVLVRPSDPPEAFQDVVAWGCRDGERTDLFLRLLLERLEATGAAPLRLPRWSQTEAAAAGPLLDALGFAPGRRYRRWASEAIPA
jgi:ribosomal protein S18 acetylase RimI-like enzyme